MDEIRETFREEQKKKEWSFQRGLPTKAPRFQKQDCNGPVKIYTEEECRRLEDEKRQKDITGQEKRNERRGTLSQMWK